MILLSYLGSHWLLFLAVLLSIVGLGAAAWFLKNWKFAAAAILIAVAGLAYQSSNMDGYKRRVNEEAQVQIKLLQTRLLALNMIAAQDAQRAVADAYLNTKLETLARDTPPNAAVCLNAAAAHRVWAVRQLAVTRATPVPARRVPNVLQTLRRAR